MTKLAMFAAATLLAAAPAVSVAKPGDDAKGPGYLGVRLQEIEGGLAEALEIAPGSGVLLAKVEEDSPAEKAGLQKGDVVTKVGSQAVGTPDELRTAIRGNHEGDTVKLTILRDGKTRTLDAHLTAAPKAMPGSPRLMRERAPGKDGADSPRRDRMRDHMRDIREMRLGRERGWLGVSTQPLTGGLGEFFGAKDGGALVAEVVEDSPAQKLGLKAGDVIVKVDDTNIEDPADLSRVVGQHDEPAEVQITWVRDHKSRDGKVQLEVRDGLAFFGGDGEGPGGMHGFDWMTDDDGNGMRQRVHALRMRTDEATDHALEELKAQVEKLQDQVETLQKGK